eukprot:6213346-Pleurochrysis_carterae.AAC.3
MTDNYVISSDGPPDEFLVSQIALHGEKALGVAGVVWIDETHGSAKYIGVDDIKPDDVRSRVSQLLLEDSEHFIYVVTRQHHALHIMKLARTKAMSLVNSSFRNSLLQ